MFIIMLGAPGAGKGTQAENLSKTLGIPTISSGKIIRNAIAEGQEMGLKLKSCIDKGELAPDDIMTPIVAERLSRDDCKNGFILDGFPRTLAQAEALEQAGVVITRVILIDVEDGDIVERLSGRRECPVCGVTFHTKYNPTATPNICDVCGAELVIRDDDKPDVIRNRLKVYHSQTEPLIDYYRNKGKLRIAKGCEKIEDTTKNTLEAAKL